MNKKVDYDEMFGTGPTPESVKNRQYEERCRRESAERNELNESVDSFRKRPKIREGLFERSDCFSDTSFSLQKSNSPMTRRQRENYVSEQFRTDLRDCFDGIAVGTLLAVIVWMLYPEWVAVTAAGAVGFICGLALKLLVNDRYPKREALRHGLRYIHVGILFAGIVYILSGGTGS